MYRFMSKQFIVLFAGLLVLCSIQFISPPKMRGLILTRKTGTRVLKGGGGGGGGFGSHFPVLFCEKSHSH